MTEGSTVNRKLALALARPSATVKVISVLPAEFRAGITVTVRLEPKPPKTMFPLGINVGFDETAESVRFAGSSKASSMVTERGPAEELVPITWSATAERVGGG